MEYLRGKHSNRGQITLKWMKTKLILSFAGFLTVNIVWLAVTPHSNSYCLQLLHNYPVDTFLTPQCLHPLRFLQ